MVCSHHMMRKEEENMKKKISVNEMEDKERCEFIKVTLESISVVDTRQFES